MGLRLKIIYPLHRFVEGGPPYHPPSGPHLRCPCCLHLVDCRALVAAAITVYIAATATTTVVIAVDISTTADVAVAVDISLGEWLISTYMSLTLARLCGEW